jgi:hypothetical protein
LTSLVALGQVGIVLALEVSRLARRTATGNGCWLRLTDTRWPTLMASTIPACSTTGSPSA